jgi:pyrophosphatase PpaX
LNPIRCVLFDLDGTVLNTNHLIIESFRYTFRHHLGIEIVPKDIYPYFGEPLITTLRRYSPELAEDMIETYREFNWTNHDRLTTTFPGAARCLEDLSTRGFRVAVVTSKLRRTAHHGLEFFGLNRWVETIVAYEDTERHKPYPEPILKALEILDFGSEGVLMVGDSPLDLRCAKAAGVQSAAVSWSVYPLGELVAESPEYVLASLDDLINGKVFLANV